MKKMCAFFLVLTIVVSIIMMNQPALSKTKSISFIEKDGSILLPSQKSKSNPASDFTQAPLRNADWKAFFERNGKWTVMIEKATMTPHRALGKPVQINNYDNISEANIKDASMQFLRDNAKILNINPDNLIFTKTKKVNKLWYVGFRQVYKGIEVLLSEIELRIREDAKVIAFGVDFYNNINISTTPTVPLSKAMNNAHLQD
ncbi:MAG: hypothetical protein EPN82_07130 [Bacteroidetes bacterium]|nr:MAG: hypothetical protein EPN82_07130 [Bacteroidota bacterium]